MTTFKSQLISVNHSAKKVFDFLSDFRNFEKLMPDQVINWKATEDQCSFTIKGMADMAMRMGDNIPPVKITYLSEGKSPISFNLEFSIDQKETNRSDVQVILNANLNPMLKMMASRPLQNFVTLLAEKLKEVMGDN
ncbi:MAG: hypothetical protein KDC05_05890 [Bacteroidales bacterium]|nr:hypothetical protein [Bacteroidales bacterium]